MISDPIEFCKEMESSGVSKLEIMLSKTPHCSLPVPINIHWTSVKGAQESHSVLRNSC